MNYFKNLQLSKKNKVLNFYHNKDKAGLLLNYRKISKNNLEQLFNLKLTNIPWYNNGYVIEDKEKLSYLKSSFSDLGLFYITNPNELYPITLIDIKPGHEILDLYSSSSGVRTIQAGLLLENKGVLTIASENEANIMNTTNNLQSFGISNFVTVNLKKDRFLEDKKEIFDRILVTPNINMKDEVNNYTKMPEKMRKKVLTKNTREIYRLIEKAFLLLKSGGKLLYSSCGNSFIEEHIAVKNLLKKYINAKVYENADGKFTKLILSNKFSEKKMFIIVIEKANKETIEEFENIKFYNESDIEKYIKFEEKYMNVSFKDNVKRDGYRFYLRPNINMDLSALDENNIGSTIGCLKANSFFPLQALAFLFKKEDFKNYYELSIDSEEYKKYKNFIKFKTNLKDDLYLIGCMGFPIGWGRVKLGNLVNITKKYII